MTYTINYIGDPTGEGTAYINYGYADTLEEAQEMCHETEQESPNNFLGAEVVNNTTNEVVFKIGNI